MTIEVRPAVAADARGIATVHVEAWREAYPHLLSADTLARLSIDQRELRWAELIPADRPDAWVAVDGGIVIGWATSSRGHLADEPRDLELEGIYIRASHYGSGAGQALLDAAVGTQPAFLCVADDNPRAIAFYERNGFARDGTRNTVPLAGTPVEVVRLVR
ncbi:MAG TPA: GNAT family N-acetyltransferase [Galbitalea sp.]|jgi:ribosomal protein S18 acetylase RimI-like enzyme|nr:GNAT family N-acetyltransferase [Galbitalea sp.]